jgi:hypothetical protein
MAKHHRHFHHNMQSIAPSRREVCRSLVSLTRSGELQWERANDGMFCWRAEHSGMKLRLWMTGGIVTLDAWDYEGRRILGVPYMRGTAALLRAVLAQRRAANRAGRQQATAEQSQLVSALVERSRELEAAERPAELTA